MAVDERAKPGGEDDPQSDGDPASVVLVDRADELAAICGRVDGSPAWAVVIHAPEGNRQLSTELGMRRLLHHASESGKTVAIATRSSALSSRARELNIPVARKPHLLRWDAGGKRVVRIGRLSLAAPSIGRYVQIGIIAGVAMVGIFLLLTMAPSATVTAFPPTETVTEVVTVAASEGRTEISLETMEVPASRVTGEQTFTLAIKTTGSALVGVVPAKAAVTIANSTQAAVAVGAGSVLLAGPERLRFLLDEAVTVPAGGSMPVSATAERPGPAGNVGAGLIANWEAPRLQFLKVTNPAPAAGGLSEPRPAVDSKDVLALKDLARSLEGSEAMRAKLAESHPRDAIFLDTAESKAEFGDARPAVGTPAALVLLDVKVKLSALAVVEGTLELLARQVLAGRSADGEFIPGSVTAVETGARHTDAETGAIRTELRLQAELARGVTSEAIRGAVKGKSESRAKSTLAQRYGIQDVEVRLSSWAPRLPRFGFRIHVGLAARAPTLAAGLPSPNGTIASTTAAATPAPGAGPR